MTESCVRSATGPVPGRSAFCRQPRAAIGLAVLATLLSHGAAVAQVDRTGTGGGPRTTITAPYTARSGATLPPDRADSPTSTDDPRRTREERAVDRVEGTICTGCGVKP